MAALKHKLVSPASLFRLRSVGSHVADPLATDLSANQLLQLGWGDFRAQRHLNCNLGGEPVVLGGVAYLAGVSENRDVISAFLGETAPRAPEPEGSVQPGLLVAQLHGARSGAIAPSRRAPADPPPHGVLAVVKSNRVGRGHRDVRDGLRAVVERDGAVEGRRRASPSRPSGHVIDFSAPPWRTTSARMAASTDAGSTVFGLARSAACCEDGREAGHDREPQGSTRSSRSSSPCSSWSPTTTRRMRIRQRSSTTWSSTRRSSTRTRTSRPRSCRRRPRSPTNRDRLRAVAPAVVGVVEAGSLEVDRRRVQHLLDGCATFDALRQRIVAHALHDVEQVPVGAAVLVDRHAFSIPTLALGIGQCQG